MGSVRISKYKISELKNGFWVKTKNDIEIRYMLEKWLSLYGNKPVTIGTCLKNNYSINELLTGDLDDVDYAGVSFDSLSPSTTKHSDKDRLKYIENYNKYSPGLLTKDLTSMSIVENYDITGGNEDVSDICIGFKDFEIAFECLTQTKQGKREILLNKLLS